MKIIERVPCYTDQMMLDRCLVMQKTLSKTEPYKVGRGRGVRTLYRSKHNVEPEVMSKINNSVEYYRKLVECEL